MTEAIQQGIQRILVAFDNSRRMGITLETAAELAADLRAELHGIFVEDENLFRLACMPFACEIGGTSASPRPLNLEGIERTCRANAEEAKRALIANARRVRVEWAFEVCRGQLLATTFAAAERADLTIVEPNSSILDWLPNANRRLARGLTPASSPSLLGGNKPPKQIVVIMDGTSCAFRALQIAIQLCRSAATELIVFLVPKPGISFEELRDQTNKIIQEQPSPAGLSVEIISSMECIIQKLKVGKRCFRLALLNRTNLVDEEPLVQLMIQHLHCPLALVR
ncbi:MAG: universal stress protein [Pirellula sp.]